MKNFGIHSEKMPRGMPPRRPLLRLGSDARHVSSSDGNDVSSSCNRATLSTAAISAASSTTAEAAAAADDSDWDAERVYRPLLFQSADYASSELFRDSFEMRARLQQQQQEQQTQGGPTTPNSPNSPSKRPRGAAAPPRIRLETLSSRAASSVLAVTYLAFALALATPYLQSRGFLGAAVTLPGGICDGRPAPREPCIVVDRAHGVARWSGFVNNVSRFAGSVELALRIQDVGNASTSLFSTQDDDGDSEGATLQKMDALWQLWRPNARAGGRSENGGDDAAPALDVEDQSFVLAYDAFLYGVDVDTTPSTKVEIAAERNQSVWVECPSTACNKVTLLDVSQEFVARVSPLLWRVRLSRDDSSTLTVCLAGV